MLISSTRDSVLGGDVTCLNVHANRAVIGYFGVVAEPGLGFPYRHRGFIEVVDNGSPGVGRDTVVRQSENYRENPPGEPQVPEMPLTTCPDSLAGTPEPIPPLPSEPGGDPPRGIQDFVVVDAHPLPTAKDQCKNGGWKAYDVFKNQGDCVSFVATGGKHPPGKAAG